MYTASCKFVCQSRGRCQLTYLTAAAFLLGARNGENLVFIAVAVNLGGVDVRTGWQGLGVVRNAWTTGVTFLTRNGVNLQPTSHVGALTRLDAMYMLARRQFGLKDDVSCNL